MVTTENVTKSDAIKVPAEAAFRLISDFATIALDLSKQLWKHMVQGMSRNSQTPITASDPGNPNQLSGNTTLVPPPRLLAHQVRLVMPTGSLKRT